LRHAFDFILPINIKIGEGLLAETGKFNKEGGNKILIVTDSGIRRTGIADKVWNSLYKKVFLLKGLIPWNRIQKIRIAN